ncbi:hypothetical protein B0H13DRAFT_2303472 [Mycena leptocephala]|nr:hypothetical protein B0H13DRAFT_2303472 [Mycena leptocephala]
MAVDLIAIVKLSDILIEEAGEISSLVACAFTTPPSILIQNCAFLTIFLASMKILMINFHHECPPASTLPPPIKPSVDGSDDVGFVPCPRGEANETASDSAFQPDNHRYPTRHKVRILEEKSGERNG